MNKSENPNSENQQAEEKRATMKRSLDLLFKATMMNAIHDGRSNRETDEVNEEKGAVDKNLVLFEESKENEENLVHYELPRKEWAAGTPELLDEKEHILDQIAPDLVVVTTAEVGAKEDVELRNIVRVYIKKDELGVLKCASVASGKNSGVFNYGSVSLKIGDDKVVIMTDDGKTQEVEIF